MKTLDNSEFNWVIKSNKRENPSKHHLKVREFLNNFYRTSKIYEEVSTQILRGQYVYLDFYIPLYKIAIEADGQQHYKFNSFHYKDKLQFLNAQNNDRAKENWCRINNIKLIRFLDNESTNDWTYKLLYGPKD